MRELAGGARRPADGRLRGAGPPLVGRGAELGWLAGRLRAAARGAPYAVFCTAEAGLGKTRLVAELEARARAGRLFVCRGRGYEDLAQPLGLFSEVLRAQLADAPEASERLLGEEAERIAALARGATSPGASAERWRDAESGRLAQLVAVSRAVVELARIRPTLLVLDDLHWADEPSLDQLQHLVFTVADAVEHEPVPLLLVGLARAPQGRLLRLLARLEGESLCERLPLEPLEEGDVAELLVHLGIRRPSHRLVTDVHRLTRGNPLFVQGVVHELRRQGALRSRGGYTAPAGRIDALHLPATLTDAVTRRVGDVRDRCREVLTFAAFLGDRFSLPQLASIGGFDEEALLDLLDEAHRAGILHSEGETFAFAHPLLRHVLYAAPSDPRRRRIHRRIAENMEALAAAPGSPTDAMALAHHWIRAGELAEPERVAAYGRRAGDLAFERFAWGEAARFYDTAIEALAACEGVPGEERADLYTRAGTAHYRNMDVGPCLEYLRRALALYHEAGDLRSEVVVRSEELRARLTQAAVPYGTALDVEPLEHAVEALGESEPTLRAEATSVLAWAYWNQGASERAEALGRRALEIGEAAGDRRVFAGSGTLALAQAQRLHVTEALHTLETAIAHARDVADPWLKAWPLKHLAQVLVWKGRLAEAERRVAEASELLARTRDWADESQVLATQTSVLVARGAFDEAEDVGRRALSLARRSHYPWGAIQALPALACARSLRGRAAEAEAALAQLAEPGAVFDQPGPVIEAAVGIALERLRAARGAPGAATPAIAGLLEGLRARPDIQLLPLLAFGVETAALRGEGALAARCAEPLAAAAEAGVLFTTGWPFLLERVRGVAAAAAGELEDADALLRRAAEQAAETGARPELALAWRDRARVLLRRGGAAARREAAELVRSAVPLLEELGMQPALEETLELAGRLGEGLPRSEVRETAPAWAPETPPDSPTLLLTDMVNFTELIERLGEDRAQAVVHTHNLILRACIRAHRGREIQHTGDGILVAFGSAPLATACAQAVQRDLARHNAAAEERIAVRIGVHAGPARAEEDRLFGAAVNATARICASAGAGEVLLSDTVLKQIDAERFPVKALEPVRLKGFATPFRLHALQQEH